MSSDNHFDAHLSETMRWHFSADTGSPFWLDRRAGLDFDPVADVRTFADLRRFPDVADELRTVPVRDLVPRGLAGAGIAGVFESGGTTGPPKRVIVFDEWLEALVGWRLDGIRPAPGVVRDVLAMVPTGPHVVGAINRLRARTAGGLFFSVDMDPRWVKKLIGQGKRAEVDAYGEHLVDQAENIVRGQHVSCLIATPPLLERIARRRWLAERLNDTLDLIIWGGTQMDPDTLAFLGKSVFPDVRITASYGSTMILGEARGRDGEDHDGSPVFDSFSPYVSFEVVDADTGAPVGFGERGRVVMNHVSRFALYPNVLERDTAVRLPAPAGAAGVSVSGIRPVAQVRGQAVVEGVY